MVCHALGPRQARVGPDWGNGVLGVKWIYLARDSLSALFYLRERKLTLREWWSSVRGPKAFAVFSWRDPLPFFLDLWERSNRGDGVSG